MSWLKEMSMSVNTLNFETIDKKKWGLNLATGSVSHQ